MAKLKLDITHEFDLLNDNISQLIAKFGNLEPILGAVGDVLQSSTKTRIATTKTAPDGARWADILPSTKAKKGRDDILIDTSSLIDSVIYQVTGNTLEVGTAMTYAPLLQLGTKNMPAREFLGISDDDRRQIDARLTEFLEDIFN